jgi:hypothetical protein
MQTTSKPYVGCVELHPTRPTKNASRSPPPPPAPAPPTPGRPLQCAVSRSPVSRVWSKTVRPGPADYTLAGAMGKQAESRNMSNLGKAFGKESREGYNLNPSLSDQFLFDHEVGLGKQLTSKRPTQPRAHFGTSNREHSVCMYSAHTYRIH